MSAELRLARHALAPLSAPNVVPFRTVVAALSSVAPALHPQLAVVAARRTSAALELARQALVARPSAASSVMVAAALFPAALVSPGRPVLPVPALAECASSEPVHPLAQPADSLVTVAAAS